MLPVLPASGEAVKKTTLTWLSSLLLRTFGLAGMRIIDALT